MLGNRNTIKNKTDTFLSSKSLHWSFRTHNFVNKSISIILSTGEITCNNKYCVFGVDFLSINQAEKVFWGNSALPENEIWSLSMGFSRQEYQSGLPFLLQRIFPTLRSNLGLPHCGQTLYHLSQPGSSKSNKEAKTEFYRERKQVQDGETVVLIKKRKGDECGRWIWGRWQYVLYSSQN